jgi:ferric-dicitrate binding protein FerR (iron transport regulator)
MNLCDQHARVQDYLDGVLPEAESRRFALHLSGCAACASELELYRRVFALARAVPLLDPSPGFAERVLDRVLPSRARRRAWVRRVGLAYAAAVAACLVAVGSWALHPASIAWMSSIGAIASRRLVQLAIFTLNAGSSALLDLAGGWGLISATGVRLAPLGRALATVFGSSGVGLTLSLAGLACVALLWWMRPRRDGRGGRMRHVGVLGF